MSARRVLAGLSLLPAEDVRAAALPLFEAGSVDAIEWTIDGHWGTGTLPSWTSGLLDHYASAGRLYGHGIGLSPLSCGDRVRQDAWLARARQELSARRYVHVSEHYGFGTGGTFVFGAPLPCPRTVASLRAGREALQRLSDAADAPVGLENLALAFGPRDVADQPAMLEEILAPLDGFLLLDVHNLWCQARNFGLDASELLARYPLDRVREIHVSGGSWSDGLRRDTHDDGVPPEVFALLRVALARCPHAEVVFLERLGGTIRDAAGVTRYREDFATLRTVVDEAAPSAPALPTRAAPSSDPPTPDDDASLAALQHGLLDAFATHQVPAAALDSLASAPSPYRPWLSTLEPRMAAIAIDLLAKWAVRIRPD